MTASFTVNMAEAPEEVTKATVLIARVLGFSVVARDADNPRDFYAVIVDVNGMGLPLELWRPHQALNRWERRAGDFVVLTRASVDAPWYAVCFCLTGEFALGRASKIECRQCGSNRTPSQCPDTGDERECLSCGYVWTCDERCLSCGSSVYTVEVGSPRCFCVCGFEWNRQVAVHG